MLRRAARAESIGAEAEDLTNRQDKDLHVEPERSGRWADARQPNRKELAATLVLALPLTEWSVKVSDGPPEDTAEDLELPVWAGVLPLHEAYGEPTDAPDLRDGLEVPGYVRDWSPR